MFANAFNMKRQLAAGELGQDYHKKVKVTQGREREKSKNMKKKVQKRKNKAGLLSIFPQPAVVDR